MSIYKLSIGIRVPDFNDVGSEYVFLSSVSHDKVNLSTLKGS